MGETVHVGGTHAIGGTHAVEGITAATNQLTQGVASAANTFIRALHETFVEAAPPSSIKKAVRADNR